MSHATGDIFWSIKCDYEIDLSRARLPLLRKTLAQAANAFVSLSYRVSHPYHCDFSFSYAHKANAQIANGKRSISSRGLDFVVLRLTSFMRYMSNAICYRINILVECACACACVRTRTYRVFTFCK